MTLPPEKHSVVVRGHLGYTPGFLCGYECSVYIGYSKPPSKKTEGIGWFGMYLIPQHGLRSVRSIALPLRYRGASAHQTHRGHYSSGRPNNILRGVLTN